MIRSPKIARFGIGLAAAALLSGCATSNNPKDPFEGFNRAMFGFNEGVDKVVLKPAATAYKEALPEFVQTSVGNFFGNIGDVWTAFNNLLQGNVEEGMSDVTRVAMNTVFGFAGVLDIASEAGLPKHNEDFGQTLGKWGIESGPYLVLPLLGPSTVRDTAALPIDTFGDPWYYAKPSGDRNIGFGVRIIDYRAAALNASNLLEEAAIDKYEFVRDGFLQRRERQVHNDKLPGGEAKQSKEEDDWVTVTNDTGKPSGAAAVNHETGGVPTDAASRGSAARAVYTYGIRPR